MWLIAEFQPVGLFSFKVGVATATGAKTLFLPTPFAIRTSLLDAAIRTQGLTVAPDVFEQVKTLSIAVLPPQQVVVTNLFTKVLKPPRPDASPDIKGMQKTIAFREYAYLTGCLTLAFGGPKENLNRINSLLPQITYFGKRGSFFQLLESPKRIDELPANFSRLEGIAPETNETNPSVLPSFSLGIIQVMDDWGPTLSLERVDIYNNAKIRLGKRSNSKVRHASLSTCSVWQEFQLL